MGLIILVSLLAVIIVIFIEGAILTWVTKLFKTENPSYKKSLIIVIVSGMVGGVTGVVFDMISLGFLATILAFFVVHYFLKKYYQSSWKKSLGIFVVTGIIGSIVALLVALPVRTFIFEPFAVAGEAMSPTYKNGDYLIINKLNKEFDRGDVIVFRYPKDPNQFFIKRIIGLPGEKIQVENGKVLVNGQIIQESYLSNSTSTFPHNTEIMGGEKAVILGQNEYFVLGDNRLASSDSRDWGTIAKSSIRGKISYKIGWVKFPTNSPQSQDQILKNTLKTYTNTQYGFEFKYPPNSTIELRQDLNYQYIRLQNYSSTDDRMGLAAGEYYLEIFIFDNSLGHKSSQSCQQSVVNPKKVELGTVAGYRGYGEEGGDAGGIRFALCAERPEVYFYIQGTENNEKAPLVNPIFDSFRFIH